MRANRKIREPGARVVPNGQSPGPSDAGAKQCDIRLVDGSPTTTDAAAKRVGTGVSTADDGRLDWSVLMARAQDGDGGAYAYLLRDMTPYVRCLAAARLRNAAEIEDAVQDVLLTIHRQRHTYDPDRPFGPWLVTIAKRRIIDKFRETMRRNAKETALLPSHETFWAAPANNIDERADHHVLRKAIDDLPPSQREAIRMLKLEEMSLKEASAATGMSVSALKVATHRALKRLKAMLETWSD